MKKSYFDGGLLQLIGWKILGFLVTFFTLGICYPWSVCMIYGWETKHTVINGKRLGFDGKAIQLFGSWIKWFLLTFITLGIYGFWVGIALKKWKVKHTYFIENESDLNKQPETVELCTNAIQTNVVVPIDLNANYEGAPDENDPLLNTNRTGSIIFLVCLIVAIIICIFTIINMILQRM